MAQGRLVGAIAASVTPLRDNGDTVDVDAIAPLVAFLADAGLDGILAMGTTGEGILLDRSERLGVAEEFVTAARGRLSVIVHCGAQTTQQTAALAADAAKIGADGAAVISPPYFALDDRSLFEHLRAAARACSPLPFYLYEFAARAGYAIPLAVIDKLRDEVPNLTGIKVSSTPWERFEPYLIEGLDIFVGPEGYIHRGLERGAVGAVSALATAIPELVIDAVRHPSAETSERCEAVRDALQEFPFHAALKVLLARRGVPVREDVRAPLRIADRAERRRLDERIEELLASLNLGERVEKEPTPVR
jgi:dihydrodipicolinate synthase/N-acetylneuraminate lyase